MTMSPLFIHIPAQLLAGKLPFLLNRNLQPEVACQDVSLDKLDYDQLEDCARQLSEKGLSTTLHAPYSGFNPGSRKRRIRDLSLSMAERSLRLAEKIKARRIVFHPGLPFDSNEKKQKLWLEAALEFWPQFIDQAKSIDTVICVENIYETEPDLFVQLLSELDSPSIGHVFDIGHWHMFSSTDLIEWLNRLEPYLQHLHLHDNHGERDEHLAIGQGTVPFSSLFDWLKHKNQHPTITIENRSLPSTEASLQIVRRHLPEM